MTVRRLSIAAMLLCCFALVVAGCSQSGADDAQAAVEKAKAELQDAQAQLDKTSAEHKKTAQKKVQAAGSETKQAERRDQPVCNDCGTVRFIAPITQKASKGSGVGAVAGGVAGAVVGSQIGHGAGKTIAQIAGTLGGAYAGNEVEKRVRKETYYQVNVAMDAGGTRSVKVNTANAIASGTRVRVQGNNLVLLQ